MTEGTEAVGMRVNTLVTKEPEREERDVAVEQHIWGNNGYKCSDLIKKYQPTDLKSRPNRRKANQVILDWHKSEKGKILKAVTGREEQW